MLLVSTGRTGGKHPESDECDPDDLQHLVLLQHVRANDVALCEDHQSDDHHMQSLHQHGRFKDLGPSKVSHHSNIVITHINHHVSIGGC